MVLVYYTCPQCVLSVFEVFDGFYSLKFMVKKKINETTKILSLAE